MDLDFFQERLLVICRYRYSHILLAKERLYYYRYVRKLSYHIRHLWDTNVATALIYVQKFESKESQIIRNGWIVKPKRMLALACEDTKDVLKSMERWDGICENNP